MPTTTDHHGCKITWHGRSNSIVTMQSRVLVHGQGIPIKISIYRNVLGQFFEPSREAALLFEGLGQTPLGVLALSVAVGIRDIAQLKPRPRRTVISKPLYQNRLIGRISVSTSSWNILNKCFSEPPGATQLSTLSLMIQLFFFWGGGLRRVLHPARGRWAGQPILGDYLPTAYLACRRLLKESEHDGSIDHLITSCLEELRARDPKASTYLDQAKNRPDPYQDRMFTIALVYRAFEGAWIRYKIDGLPEVQQGFEENVYRHKSLQDLYDRLERLGSDVFEDLVDEWKGLYLSRRGAAARHFRLI